MSDRTYVYTTYIAVSRERVWEALTSAAFTEQYWGGTRVESDWSVGSPVVASHPERSELYGTVLRAEPPHVLSYTFQHAENEANNDTPTRVLFELRAFGSGCTAHRHPRRVPDVPRR